MVNKSKECKLCMLHIGSKEHYCVLREYQEAKEKSVGYYHVKCFKERFMGFEKIQKEASSILGGFKGMLGKMEGNNDGRRNILGDGY